MRFRNGKIKYLDAQISRLIQNKLNERVLKIKDSSKGEDQIVRIIETNKRKLVVKIAKNTFIQRQIFAHQKLKDNVPLAKILFEYKNMIIEEFIPGKDMASYNHLPKQVFYSLGKIIKRIHSINLKGFGFINDGSGQYKSFRLFFKKYFREEKFNNLVKYKIVNKKELIIIKQYVSKNRSYLTNPKSKLLHFDFNADNIKINKNRISGLLDFADIVSGPPSMDFMRLYIRYHGPEFDEIIRGYGEIDIEEIRYYSVLMLVRLLPYFEHKEPLQFKRYKQLFWDIILKS